MLLPTIALAKEIQASLGLCDTHVVWLGETGFTIAHTDFERATLDDLHDCHLHRWLSDYSPPSPNQIGWRIAAWDSGASIYRMQRVDRIKAR